MLIVIIPQEYTCLMASFVDLVLPGVSVSTASDNGWLPERSGRRHNGSGLEAFIRKASQARFYNCDKTLASLCESADSKLFKSVICDPNHVLFPSIKTHSPPQPAPPDLHNQYLPKSGMRLMRAILFAGNVA